MHWHFRNIETLGSEKYIWQNIYNCVTYYFRRLCCIAIREKTRISSVWSCQERNFQNTANWHNAITEWIWKDYKKEPFFTPILQRKKFMQIFWYTWPPSSRYMQRSIMHWSKVQRWIFFKRIAWRFLMGHVHVRINFAYLKIAIWRVSGSQVPFMKRSNSRISYAQAQIVRDAVLQNNVTNNLLWSRLVIVTYIL